MKDAREVSRMGIIIQILLQASSTIIEWMFVLPAKVSSAVKSPMAHRHDLDGKVLRGSEAVGGRIAPGEVL